MELNPEELEALFNQNKVLPIDYFDPNITALRKSLDELILTFQWRTYNDHQRAIWELETIALNYIEFHRSGITLLVCLVYFTEDNHNEILKSLKNDFILQVMVLVTSCRKTYVTTSKWTKIIMQ